MIRLITAVFIFLLTACTSAPEESEIRKVVTDYFQLKGYEIVNIDIGEIRSMPMGEKQYMGTPGFDVDIRRITFIVGNKGQETWSLEKGKEYNYENGVIRVKKRTGPVKDWIIVNIKGIPVL